MDPAKNLKALQGALEHSLTIQRARVQEIIDDLVSRGTLDRDDADGLLAQLISSSKDYSQALLQVLESVTAPVVATAGKAVGRIAETVRQASPLTSSPKPEVEPAVVAEIDVEVDPIPGYDDLTVAQIKPRLDELDPSGLRRVREIEQAGKARKTVLEWIDQRLKSS